MRLPYLLLPLALLFSIGSCIEHLLPGKWRAARIKDSQMDFWCCVPRTIDIEEDTTSGALKATFDYIRGDEKCDTLFGTRGYFDPSGKVKIYNQTNPLREKYVSEVLTRYDMQLYFDIAYDYGQTYPNLNVYSLGSSKCNFSMAIREAWPAPYIPTPVVIIDNGTSLGGGNMTFWVSLIVVVVVVIVAVIAILKSGQSKQVNAITAQYPVQQPNIQVYQQYGGQPQANYNAPNQFPNAQMNINYGTRF